MTSEAECIQLARKGDQAAFGRLVHAYQKPVYNLTYRMLGNASEAEEAAQETFLRAYSHFHSYDPNRAFRSWLLSIASHYCIDRLRRRRIMWLSLEEEIAAPGDPADVSKVHLGSDRPSPEKEMVAREQEKHIQQMMATLSATDRAAVTLRYWYDCSYEEIADVLDLTVSAVKSRLHRARRAMAEMMEDETQGEMDYAMQAC